MTPDALAEHFRTELGERVLAADVAYDQLTVTVDPEHFAQAALFCKQNLGMTFFDFLAGVDEREEGFSVVARVYNHVTRQGVLLRAMAAGGREAPRIPTLTEVYRGANWHERETYDMFGIVFEGHPGLLPRILTVENFEGWPLRKEFLLTSREVKPWPGAKEPGGDDEEAKPAASTPAPGQDPADRAAAAKEKAERAKKKAAEARARKAAEKAAAQGAENPAGSEAPGSGPAPEDKAAAQAPADDDSAQAPADDAPDPGTPEGAAEIADTAIAKDAAAGSTVGPEATPGEQAGSGEPDIDPAEEAHLAQGGSPEPGGTPGVEAEGTHDLESSSARPSVEGDPAGGSGSDADEGTDSDTDAGDDDE